MRFLVAFRVASLFDSSESQCVYRSTLYKGPYGWGDRFVFHLSIRFACALRIVNLLIMRGEKTVLRVPVSGKNHCAIPSCRLIDVIYKKKTLQNSDYT